MKKKQMMKKIETNTTLLLYGIYNVMKVGWYIKLKSLKKVTEGEGEEKKKK